MGSVNSQCVISVPDRFQNGFPTTDVTASRSGSAATPRLIGASLNFHAKLSANVLAAVYRNLTTSGRPSHQGIGVEP